MEGQKPVAAGPRHDNKFVDHTEGNIDSKKSVKILGIVPEAKAKYELPNTELQPGLEIKSKAEGPKIVRNGIMCLSNLDSEIKETMILEITSSDSEDSTSDYDYLENHIITNDDPLYDDIMNNGSISLPDPRENDLENNVETVDNMNNGK